MEKKERIEIAKEYIKKARTRLKSAEILLHNNMLEDAISRAYYATYLAAYAVLYLLGESPKTHDGLLVLFGLRLVKQGLVDKKYAKILNKLRRMREECDYGVFTYLEEQEVRELIQNAKDFVTKMEELINEIQES